MAIVSFIFYKNYKASIFTYIIVYESSPLLGELEEALLVLLVEEIYEFCNSTCTVTYAVLLFC